MKRHELEDEAVRKAYVLGGKEDKPDAFANTFGWSVNETPPSMKSQENQALDEEQAMPCRRRSTGLSRLSTVSNGGNLAQRTTLKQHPNLDSGQLELIHYNALFS